MQRAELEHAIRSACEIVKSDTIIVIGSQSVLGTWTESELPVTATLSAEVDMLPVSDESEALARKLDLVGEMSDFHQLHGFYIDGVSRATAVLPDGWEERLVEVPTASLKDGSRLVGLCLDPHDVCVAKLVANRQKDLRFVGDLVEAGMIDPALLMERLMITTTDLDVNHAFVWVQSHL